MAAHRSDARRLLRRDPEHVADVLSAIPLFHVIGAEGILAVARAGRAAGYLRGEIVCRQGDPGDHLYAVLDGLVEVVFTTERGDEVVLNTAGRTGVFGELSVLDRSPR